MPKTNITKIENLPTESYLHGLLRGSYADGINGKISIHQRFSEIKEKAQEWLKDLGKNGYRHSERLEGYLGDLTKGLTDKEPMAITTAEIFVLLCAVYMHDIGYWYNGELISKGHPERSREYILSDPAKYLFDDFPPFKGNHSRVAEAVAWVAHGHSEERFLPLMKVPNNFPDQALTNEPLNLRMLTAFLRMADEADDPYIRVEGVSDSSIRSGIPLVTIGAETIAWHWEYADVQDQDFFKKQLRTKTEILVSSVDYLRDTGSGNWYLVLAPQVVGAIPYMAEKPVDTFVGREPDLEALHKNIREGGITGVAGTGGIGKTEFAKRYAQIYRNDYPGGVFWASFKGSDWRSEAHKILAVIRPGAEPMPFLDAPAAKEYVNKALDRKRALLIIDNVNEADEIIEPGCSVLVTTRNKGAFGILPKESVYPLKRFDENEGLDLLKKILGEPRVNGDHQGAARLVEILGGMPLAIEIAAKHLDETPDITFPQYIGWVQGKVERLKIKDNPDKDVIVSLTLSLEDLEKEDRGDELLALFEAAAICAETGFTSRVLVEVAGFGNEDRMVLRQLVGRLYGRSLLEYSEESVRFTMHPLVRQMAESRLKGNTETDLLYRQNHSLCLLHYAQAHNDRPLDLIREHDELLLAMVHTIQVGWLDEKLPAFVEFLSSPFQRHLTDNDYDAAFRYLMASGLLTDLGHLGRNRELVGLLEPLVNHGDQLRDWSLSWALNSLGLAYSKLGENHKAIEFYKHSLEIFRRIGDVQGEGSALGNMGVVYRDLGEYRKAIELHEHSLEIFRRIGDAQGEGSALGNMGSTYINLGEYRKAIDLHEQHLDIARRTGHEKDEGNALGNIGLAYSELEKRRKAIDLHKQHLDIARRIGHVEGEGNALIHMGIAYSKLGENHKAIELYKHSLEILRRIGDVGGVGSALGSMGVAYANLGEYRKAIEFHEQYLEVSRRIGNVRGEGASLANIGLAHTELGKSRKAIEFHEQSLEIFRRIGDAQGEGNVLGNMGIAYANLGEHRKAIEFHGQSLEISRRTGNEQCEGKALAHMGVAYINLREYRKAIELHEQSLEIFRRIGDALDEGNVLGNMGIAYANLGEHRKAIEFHEHSLEIFRRIGDVRGEGNAFANVGLVYSKLGEYHKAIEFYEQHIKIACRIGDARGERTSRSNLRLAYAKLKKNENAGKASNAAIGLFKRLDLNHMLARVREMVASLRIKM